MGQAQLVLDASTSTIGKTGLYSFHISETQNGCSGYVLDRLDITFPSQFVLESYNPCPNPTTNCQSITAAGNVLTVTFATNSDIAPNFVMKNPYKTTEFKKIGEITAVGKIQDKVGAKYSTVEITCSDSNVNKFIPGLLINANVTANPTTSLTYAAYTFVITASNYIEAGAGFKLILPSNTPGVTARGIPTIDSKILINNLPVTPKNPSAYFSASENAIYVSNVVANAMNAGSIIQFTINGIRNPMFRGSHAWTVSVYYSSDSTEGDYKNSVNSIVDSSIVLDTGKVSLLDPTNDILTNYTATLQFLIDLPATGTSGYSLAITFPNDISCNVSSFSAYDPSNANLSPLVLMEAGKYKTSITFGPNGVKAYQDFGFFIMCKNYPSTTPKVFTIDLLYNSAKDPIVGTWKLAARTSKGSDITVLRTNTENILPGAKVDLFTVEFSRISTVGIGYIEIIPDAIISQYLNITTPNVEVVGFLADAYTVTYSDGKLIVKFKQETLASQFSLHIGGLNNPNMTNETSYVKIMTYTPNYYLIDELNAKSIYLTVPCNYPCRTCPNITYSDTCLTCFNTHILNPAINKCVDSYINCTGRTIPDYYNKTCLSCDDTCDFCNGNSSSDCTSCKLDNKLRLRFYHNGECLLICPKDYTHNYQDYLCEPITINNPFFESETLASISATALAIILPLLTLLIGKYEVISTFCGFYSLFSLSELVTRILLFIELFTDLRHVPNVAFSLVFMLGMDTLFWSYKYFRYDPMIKMKSFEPYYSNYRISFFIVLCLSALAGSNVMLLLGSGLLRLPGFSQGLNDQMVFRIFLQKSSWAPCIFNACQAVLAIANIFLYSYKSQVFSLSCISAGVSTILVIFYVYEIFGIRTIKRNANQLLSLANQKRDARIDAEVQRLKSLRSGIKT